MYYTNCALSCLRINQDQLSETELIIIKHVVISA